MITPCTILQSTTGENVHFDGMTAHGSLHGLLFELAVEQHYCNRSKKNIEVVYTFPLPSNAVLLDVEVQLGDSV